MKRILAVAVLDFRRLGFGLFSAALIAGLLPALATGLGSVLTASPMAVAVFVVVGLSTGGYFGSDFSQGRASFFFARPLPAWSLILGRFLAMVTLAVVSFVAMMATNWLSTSDRSEWSLWILQRAHGEILLVTWVFSLFMSLAVAAHSRQPLIKSLQNLLRIPIRLSLVLGAVLLTFGLFADLTVRMYLSPTPIRMFFGSWVMGCLVASVVAIIFGRTERLRISGFLHRVMLVQLGLTAVTVVAAWSYLLHPGPDSITGVSLIEASPDGERAFIRARVDRGDPMLFVGTFALDPQTARAERLDVDPFQGPWLSADGRTSAWSAATPFFFRPLWRMLGGASSFRVKDASGRIDELPLLAEVTRGFRAGPLSFFNPVENVLPENQGDVFAVLWSQRLTLSSRATRQHRDVNLGPGNPRVLAWRFLESGELRVAVARRTSQGPVIDFLDINPSSGVPRTLQSMDGGLLASVRFDRTAARAVVRVSRGNAILASLFLVDLEHASPGPVALQTDSTGPEWVFLADGRIAVMSGGRSARSLTLFSAAGARLTETPLGKDGGGAGPGEMFTGILAAQVHHIAPPQPSELVLIDCASGAILRRIPGFSSQLGMSSALVSPPPPGSPAARLLLSAERQLYTLDSPTAEPRPITLTGSK